MTAKYSTYSNFKFKITMLFLHLKLFWQHYILLPFWLSLQILMRNLGFKKKAVANCNDALNYRLKYYLDISILLNKILSPFSVSER